MKIAGSQRAKEIISSGSWPERKRVESAVAAGSGSWRWQWQWQLAVAVATEFRQLAVAVAAGQNDRVSVAELGWSSKRGWEVDRMLALP